MQITISSNEKYTRQLKNTFHKYINTIDRTVNDFLTFGYIYIPAPDMNISKQENGVKGALITR